LTQVLTDCGYIEVPIEMALVKVAQKSAVIATLRIMLPVIDGVKTLPMTLLHIQRCTLGAADAYAYIYSQVKCNVPLGWTSRKRSSNNYTGTLRSET